MSAPNLKTILGLLVTTALLPGAATSQSRPSAPNKREVETLVEDYVSEGASSRGRIHALEQLQRAQPGLATTAIRAALRDDATRGRALELATNLRVEGLWSAAKLHIDGPDEDLVVRYGLTLSERGAAREITARWRAAERASTKYAIAQHALTRFPIDLTSIRSLKRTLDPAESGDPKKSDAVAILRFQLGAPGLSERELGSRWDELVSEYEANAREFRGVGDDLPPISRWEITGTTHRVARNHRLDPGTWMRLSAQDDWNQGSFTIVARVRVLEGSGSTVGLGTSQGTWEVRFHDGEWVVRSDRQVAYVCEAETGKWATIKFVVRDNSKANERMSRTCSILVNDEHLMENGWLNGEFEHFSVRSGESRAAVGGLEIIRQ